jgi:hypothetical protein
MFLRRQRLPAVDQRSGSSASMGAAALNRAHRLASLVAYVPGKPFDGADQLVVIAMRPASADWG